MAELTIDQKRALALAAARQRAAQAGGAGAPTPADAQQPTTFQPDAGDMFVRGATGGASDYVGAAGQWVGDRIANAIKPGDQEGITYEAAMQDMRRGAQNYRDKNPVSGYGAEIAGAVGSPIFRGAANVAEKGVKAAGNFIGRQVPRYLTYGAQGGFQGLLGGLGMAQNEQGGVPSLGDAAQSAGVSALAGGAMGAAVPAIAEGAAKGASKLAGAFKSAPAAPTQPQIAAQSRAAYKAAEQAGVVVKPDVFKQWVDDLPQQLEGFRPRLAPKTSDMIAELQADVAAGKPVTLELLDELRQVARGASKTMDRNEIRLLSGIVEKLDDFVDDLKPHQLLAGDAQAGAAALDEARTAYRTNMKLRNVSDIIEIGDNLNDPNWVRNQFRAIVRKPKMFNGYSKDEQEIIKQLARTGNIERLARVQPLRGVQMAAPHLAQFGQDRNAAALQNLIARGGSAPAPLFSLSPDISAMLARNSAPPISPIASALMTGGSNQ